MFTWTMHWQAVSFLQENYLRGIGIVDRSVANVPCVRTLIEQNMTISLIDRLKVLFKTRDRWTLDEIEPYIEWVDYYVI